jgi:hypothetical protein
MLVVPGHDPDHTTEGRGFGVAEIGDINVSGVSGQGELDEDVLRRMSLGLPLLSAAGQRQAGGDEAAGQAPGNPAQAVSFFPSPLSV